MQDYVYIADFTEQDRDELLEYLWEYSEEYIDPHDIFNIERAKMQINSSGGYAHVICGRKIELYIYNLDAIDMYLYDSNNGIGTVQDIVNEIREEKKLLSDKNINALFDDFKM